MSFDPLQYYNPLEGKFLKVDGGRLARHEAPNWNPVYFREVVEYLNQNSALLARPFPHQSELLTRIRLYCRLHPSMEQTAATQLFNTVFNARPVPQLKDIHTLSPSQVYTLGKNLKPSEVVELLDPALADYLRQHSEHPDEDTIEYIAEDLLPHRTLRRTFVIASRNPEYFLPLIQALGERELHVVMPFIPEKPLLEKIRTEKTPLPRLTDLLPMCTPSLKLAILGSVNQVSLILQAGSSTALEVHYLQLKRFFKAARIGEISDALLYNLGIKAKLLEICYKPQVLWLMRPVPVKKQEPATLVDLITLEEMTTPLKLPDTEGYIDATTLDQLEKIHIDPSKNYPIDPSEHRDAKGHPITDPVKISLEEDTLYVSLEVIQTNDVLYRHPINRQLYPKSAFQQ